MVRERTSFMNSARKDGLILQHWRREGESSIISAGLPVTPADSNAASEMDTDDKTTTGIQDSMAVKWNVKVERPRYSDEEYETYFKSDQWSRQETDYLVDLVIDLDLRWPVIGDRYAWEPAAAPRPDPDSMEVDTQETPAPTRTTEDLKARYYKVAAKCLELRTPLSSMNPNEFDTHEKMTKFDPERETYRKKYAERLLLRTQEETNEEERLLKELQRIVNDQEKLLEDRKSLYDRLEAPRPINSAAAQASTTIYQSSQGLNQLMQSMMQTQRLRASEQREKRRSAALGIDTENANAHGIGDGRAQRSSHGSAFPGHEKRQSHPMPQHRQLTHAERTKFGVSYPQERLVSGVMFRHERVVKASQAKSAVQTSRIGDALAELGIPARLVMPTARVVTEYERLVESVKNLVEVRKMREKVDGEIRVFEAQKELVDGDGAASQLDEMPGTDHSTNQADRETQDHARAGEAADSDEEMEDPDAPGEEQNGANDTILADNSRIGANDESEDEDAEANDDADADETRVENEDEGDDEEDVEGSEASQEVDEDDEEAESAGEREDDEDEDDDDEGEEAEEGSVKANSGAEVDDTSAEEDD